MYQFVVDKPLQQGTIINNLYKIKHVIGSGSYGIIYNCKEIQTNEIRVLKQLRPSKQRTKSEVSLFENEISIISKLQHASMPQFYEAFSVNGSLFYSMNYIEGINMEDLIFSTNRKYVEKDALAFILDLLPLVDHLHKKNIFHGDIRISNILINKGKLFLIDFGLSKIEQNDSKFLELRQYDYYDLGDVLLYLLYTNYSSKNKKALPWTEELSLEMETVHLLKRLLQIDEAYSTLESIAQDIETALLAVTKK
ncbi:protein kinase [Psychrobacillus sp. INOP01]|nr:protein kinase [Psychrobacillus sp. INOP01]